LSVCLKIVMLAGVKRFLLPFSACAFALLLLSGCLTTPSGAGGGMNSVLVSNTNVNAIIAAANDVFPLYGYTSSTMSYPDSASFDKPAGAFGKLLYGSYGTTTSMRAKLVMTPVPGTNNFQLTIRVSRVTNAGQAGFEDSRKMLGLWSGEFMPLMRKISAEAGGAGPM